MYKDLKVRFWWEKMREDIAEYIARCDTCQSEGRTPEARRVASAA
jgi:hypothetical protein